MIGTDKSVCCRTKKGLVFGEQHLQIANGDFDGPRLAIAGSQSDGSHHESQVHIGEFFGIQARFAADPKRFSRVLRQIEALEAREAAQQAGQAGEAHA